MLKTMARGGMRSNLEDDPPTTGMEHLPHEIIHDILSRLPISSLVQFKCVCRTWRALAQDPHLVKFHLSATTNSDPCLILHCDFPIRNQLYFVDFAALPDQGKDKPQMAESGKIPFQLVRRPSEALVNGRLHWVSRHRRYNPARLLVSLDLADEQFREVPKPDSGSLSRRNYHLAVLRGCLSAAVYCSYGRLEIWVMKEYNVKESWVKEYSIGTYMPKGLKQNLDRPSKIWKSALNGRVVRVLGLLQNGEVLLEYKSRVLVTYDPNLGKFKDLTLQGTPKWFQTVVHVGSLSWINTTIHT
ncbi:hypothetical protein GH714_020693 [Hevea brasiliensis]|uniref:F-box domain-containing protein n=1 Tax=Hevea brasiliensis TaxID=3981 RepID=A0A6A6KW14_HEVBR|nr:hypothetical protein GH714_020693 [Hevea brasiliensis]